jgi:hypothetical protein
VSPIVLTDKKTAQVLLKMGGLSIILEIDRDQLFFILLDSDA